MQVRGTVHQRYTSGRNFFGDAVLTSFDVSRPHAPRAAPPLSLDGLDFSSWSYDTPFALGFGSKLGVLDLSDPRRAVLRGSAVGAKAMTSGIRKGEYAYGITLDGVGVWRVGDPDRPRQVAHVELDTLATAAAASVPGGALVVTGTDRVLALTGAAGIHVFANGRRP